MRYDHEKKKKNERNPVLWDGWRNEPSKKSLLGRFVPPPIEQVFFLVVVVVGGGALIATQLFFGEYVLCGFLPKVGSREWVFLEKCGVLGAKIRKFCVLRAEILAQIKT